MPSNLVNLARHAQLFFYQFLVYSDKFYFIFIVCKHPHNAIYLAHLRADLDRLLGYG